MTAKDTVKVILINLGLIVWHAILSFIICLIGIGFNALVFAKLPTFTIWAIVFAVLIVIAEVLYYIYIFKLYKDKVKAFKKMNKEGEEILAKKAKEAVDKKEDKQ